MFVEGGAVLRLDELLVVEGDASVGVGVRSLAGESSDSLPECGGVDLVGECAEEGSPGVTTVVVDDPGDLGVEGGEFSGCGVLKTERVTLMDESDGLSREALGDVLDVTGGDVVGGGRS